MKILFVILAIVAFAIVVFCLHCFRKGSIPHAMRLVSIFVGIIALGGCVAFTVLAVNAAPKKSNDPYASEGDPGSSGDSAGSTDPSASSGEDEDGSLTQENPAGTPTPGPTSPPSSEGTTPPTGTSGDGTDGDAAGGSGDAADGTESGTGTTDGVNTSTTTSASTDTGFTPPAINTGLSGVTDVSYQEVQNTYASVPRYYMRSTSASMTAARTQFTGFSDAFSIPLEHRQEWYDEDTFFEKTAIEIDKLHPEDFPIISPTLEERLKEIEEEAKEAAEEAEREYKESLKGMTKEERKQAEKEYKEALEQAEKERLEAINDEIRERIMCDLHQRHSFYTMLRSIDEVYENHKTMIDSYFETVAQLNLPDEEYKEYTPEQLREVRLGIDFFLEYDPDHPGDIRYLRHTEESWTYSLYAALLFDEMEIVGIVEGQRSSKNWIMDPKRIDDRILSVVEAKYQESQPSFVKVFLTKEGEVYYDVRVGFNMKDGRQELFKLTKSPYKPPKTEEEKKPGPGDDDSSNNDSNNNDNNNNQGKPDGEGGKDPATGSGPQGEAPKGSGDNAAGNGDGQAQDLNTEKGNETKYHEELKKQQEQQKDSNKDLEKEISDLNGVPGVDPNQPNNVVSGDGTGIVPSTPNITDGSNKSSTATESSSTTTKNPDGTTTTITTTTTTNVGSETNNGQVGGF